MTCGSSSDVHQQAQTARAACRTDTKPGDFNTVEPPALSTMCPPAARRFFSFFRPESFSRQEAIGGADPVRWQRTRPLSSAPATSPAVNYVSCLVSCSKLRQPSGLLQ